MASFGVPWVDLSLEKRDGVRDNGFLLCAFAQLEMALPVMKWEEWRWREAFLHCLKSLLSWSED